MRSIVIMIGWAVVLPGCEQVERVDDAGRGGCVPVEVQAAFERSCGPGCHTGGAVSGMLSLEAGQSAGIIGGAAVGSPLPMVELGNTAGSYLAQKIVSDPVAAVTGDRMPIAFDPNNENQVADVNTILTWIGGGEFECAAGPGTDSSGGSESATTDDTSSAAPIQQCGTQDLKPGAVSTIVSGTEPMQIPPDIGTILDENCGCHYADALTVSGAPDYPSALSFKMDTLAGFLAERQPDEPYHQVALTRVAAGENIVPMPSEPFCNVGEGEGMPVDQRATLVQWLTEGAPDCTTWSGCDG